MSCEFGWLNDPDCVKFLEKHDTQCDPAQPIINGVIPDDKLTTEVYPTYTFNGPINTNTSSIIKINGSTTGERGTNSTTMSNNIN